MATSIKLIVGLGNPGPQYEKTRHNAGAWFVEALADDCGETLRLESKFQGLFGTARVDGHECRLLIPTTFMNHSGQAVGAVAQYYKIAPEEILVAHDELDLPTNSGKLKLGGGHGGHNGLRDIINHLGSKQFHRLRIGIGHPGHSDKVLGYVLGTPSRSDRDSIDTSITEALRVTPLLLQGDIAKAMKNMHTSKTS
ncbi:MAG: aminoacyl-tRNA hydrolase [Legionellales bacterium]|nr:aminoacyl-tRNA hydrolase [Legionellales bacterium]